MRRVLAVRDPGDEDQSSSAGCVPREGTEKWRGTLRQARREVQIIRRAIDVAERLTDGAERLINRRLRPDEARTKLANARAQLVRAGRHARAWGRCLNNTVASIAAVHQEAATEPLMAEALADGVSVSKRVAEIAGRLGAVITQYRDITIEAAMCAK